jgi:hypothetical protein
MRLQIQALYSVLLEIFLLLVESPCQIQFLQIR